MSSASTTLPAEAASVPTARRWGESLITRWGHPDVAWTACIVSELATNVALHARTPSILTVLHGDQQVRVEVSDGSVAVPVQRGYGTSATTGRGLQLVGALSDGWGVLPHADGKTVWALLSTRSPGAAEDDLETLLSRFDDGSPDDGGEDAPTGRGMDGGGPAARARAAA